MRRRRSLMHDERGFVHSVEAVLAIMLLLFYTSRMLDTPLRVHEDKKRAQLDELREQIIGVLAGLDRRGLLGDMVFCADYASLDTTLRGVFPERESFASSVTYMVPMTVTETSGLPRRRDPVEVSVDVPLATDTRSFVLRDENGKVLAPLQTSRPWMRIPFTLTWHHLWRRDVSVPLSQCTADQADYYDDIAKGLNCRNPMVELPPADINDDGFLDYPDRNSLALYMEDWFDPRWSFRIKLRSRGKDASKVSDNARITIKLHELIDHTGMSCNKGIDHNSFIVTDRLGDPVDHSVSLPGGCTCDTCIITVDWKLDTAVDRETILTHWLYFNTLDGELPAADCPSFTADVQKADSGSGKCIIEDWTTNPPNNGDGDLTPRKSVGAITVNGKVDTTNSQIQLTRDSDYVEIPFTLAAWRDAETYVESRARTGISIIRFQPVRLERAWRFRWHIRAERVNRSVEFRGFVSGAPGTCLGYNCITLEPIGGGDRPDQSKLDDTYYFNKDIYETAEGSFYLCTSTMVGDEVHEVNDIYDLFELNVTIRDEAVDSADRVWRNAIPNAFITIYKPQSRDDEGGPRCASDNSASSTWDSPLFNDDAASLISLESGLTLDQMTTLGIVRGDSSSSTTSAGVTTEAIDSVKTGIDVAPYPSSYVSILPKIPFINSAGNYRLQRRFYLYYGMNSVTLPKDAVSTGTVADPSWYTLETTATEHAPRVQVTWLDDFRPQQAKEYYLSFSVGTDESDQGYDTDLEVILDKQCYDCLSLRCVTYEDCKDYTDGDGDNIIDEDFVTNVAALNNTPIDIHLGPCSTETPSEDCDILWVAHEKMNITRHVFSNSGDRTAVIDETGPVFTSLRMTTNSSSMNSRDIIKLYHDTPYILYSKYFIPHKDSDLPSMSGSISIPIYNFTALKANGAPVFDVDEVDFSTHNEWFADWGFPCGNIGVCTVTYAVLSGNAKKATFSQDRWHDEFADTSGVTIAAAGTTNNLAANDGVMSLTADATENTGEDVLLRLDMPHQFSTVGSKLFIRAKRAYTAHGGRSSLQLGMLPDGTGRFTVARWGDTDIPDWTTMSFDLEDLWGEKPFKHVFLTIEDLDSIATGTRSLYVDSLRVEGSGGTNITIAPTSDSPKAFEAYPFLGSVRVFKEDFRESDDFFRRRAAPFIVEMERPVTLDGGTPFPSREANPSTTTATATYAVTSNSRRVGFAWVKLSVWSYM